MIRCCAGFSPCTLELSCHVTFSFSLFPSSLSSYHSLKPHSTISTSLSPLLIYDAFWTTPSLPLKLPKLNDCLIPYIEIEPNS